MYAKQIHGPLGTYDLHSRGRRREVLGQQLTQTLLHLGRKHEPLLASEYSGTDNNDLQCCLFRSGGASDGATAAANPSDV